MCDKFHADIQANMCPITFHFYIKNEIIIIIITIIIILHVSTLKM